MQVTIINTIIAIAVSISNLAKVIDSFNRGVIKWKWYKWLKTIDIWIRAELK